MAAFHTSAIGILRHPWLNRPDTKFNEDGLYHTDLILSGEAAEALASKITESAQAALDVQTQEMKAGEAKKWSLYLPFERLTDDDTGEETGEIAFSFKQNAKIKSKKEPSGFKNIKIELRDAATNIIEDNIWDGSEGRIIFTMRPITMVSSKTAGVRLDFAKVQITKLVQGSGAAGGGFDVVDGGYVAGGSSSDAEDNSPEDEDGGDY